jgi:glycosyltransferase involved in cell wall biosynthesis
VSPLTVAVDATQLSGDRTGIGVAVHGLIRGLAEQPDVRTIGYGFTTRGWSRVRAALPDGVRPARAPMPASMLLKAWNRTEWPPIEWWSGTVDVVHGTNFVVPPAARAARVVSVWDLTAVRYPELCTPVSRRYPSLVRRAVRSGAWVHTASHAVGEEIVDYYGVDPSRLRIIPVGIDFPPSDRVRPLGPRQPPYVLALGTAEPRKDLPLLVEAFDALAADHADLELRLAGPAGWGEEELQQAIDAAAHRSRVHRVGWVPDLDALMDGATVLAYPSRYEGFGIPPLEAMARGLPVVATSVGAIPEVVDDAAVLVPARDPVQLAGALDRVVSDDALRRRLIDAGHRRVERYRWSAVLPQFVSLYREVSPASY